MRVVHPRHKMTRFRQVRILLNMQRNIDSVCHWQRKLYDTDRKDTLKYTGIGLSTTDYDMYYGMQLISLVGLPQT